MTTVLTDTAATTTPSSASLRALTWLEVKRYARHPLFLLGLALTIFSLVGTADDPRQADDPSDITFFPILCIGLLGTMVTYRLDRITDRAAAATDAAPISRTTRTAAQCLATLFPGAVGGGLIAIALVARSVTFGLESWTSGSGYWAWIPMVLASVVACAGGPLFGIVTARWCRFPGAGLLAMVVLVTWTILSTSGLTYTEPTRVSALIQGTGPVAVWISADSANGPWWQGEGSPLAHLVYLTTLCFLGAVFAMVRDAQGEQRRSLWRWFAVLGVTALVMLALGALPDPVRVPLPR